MDDNDLIFYSDWKIDQIIKQGQVDVAITSGWGNFFDVVDITSLGLDYTPMFMIATRVNGTTKWSMQGGGPSYSDTPHSPLMPVMVGNVLKVYGGDSGTTYNVRYYIYKRDITEET